MQSEPTLASAQTPRGGRRVPDLHAVVVAGRGEQTPTNDAQRSHWLPLAQNRRRMHRLLRGTRRVRQGQPPQTHGAIIRARGETVSEGRESRDPGRVALECGEALGQLQLRRHLRWACGAVTAAAAAARATETFATVESWVELAEQRAEIPQLDGCVIAARGEDVRALATSHVRSRCCAALATPAAAALAAPAAAEFIEESEGHDSLCMATEHAQGLEAHRRPPGSHVTDQTVSVCAISEPDRLNDAGKAVGARSPLTKAAASEAEVDAAAATPPAVPPLCSAHNEIIGSPDELATHVERPAPRRAKAHHALDVGNGLPGNSRAAHAPLKEVAARAKGENVTNGWKHRKHVLEQTRVELLQQRVARSGVSPMRRENSPSSLIVASEKLLSLS
eukprot:jgi/Chrpa1/11654/Chrysochromulina_OHIO_Genome00014689-RA